ncbi:MAG: hypothetical protein HQK69_09725, partial [Desulfamplus sp.]|nr:hypothetical protein [Desulfamplus sp.]
ISGPTGKGKGRSRIEKKRTEISNAITGIEKEMKQKLDDVEKKMDEMNATTNTTAENYNTNSDNTTMANESINTTSDDNTTSNCDLTKCDSKYYTLKAVQETRESIKKRLDVYNDKYVKKTVDVSREFIKELNEDPLKKIDAIIDNSTKAAKTFKEDSLKKYEELKDKANELKGKTTEFKERLKNSPLKAMEEIVKDAKTDATKKLEEYKDEYKKNSKVIFEKIEKDAKTAKQDIIDASKKMLDKIEIKKVIEEKLTSTVEKFPSMLNLPSKKEVEDLIKGIDSVNRKVDSLANQPIAA